MALKLFLTRYWGTSLSVFDTLISVCAVICVFIFLKYWLWRKYYSGCLPGRKFGTFDLLGNLRIFPLFVSGTGHSFNSYLLQVEGGMVELFREKKLFCFWIGFKPFVLLTKAEAVEELISGTKNMEKSMSYSMLHPWLGTGLLTSHGAKWKSRRKMLTPSFHFDILKDFLAIFNEQSQILVEQLKKQVGEESFDMSPLITRCTLDIICETTLGAKIEAQRNQDCTYLKAVSRATETIQERMLKIWYWPEFVFWRTKMGKQFKEDVQLLHNFTLSVIKQKKQEIQTTNSEPEKRKRKAFMDLLLEQNLFMKTLTDENIREEIDTFTFEGHDTTSAGINWSLYLVGLYKDVQEKIHEELDRIFGGDGQRHVTTEDLKDMDYLERVIKESQRLYPSVPMMGRQITDDTKICGYEIPKGVECGILTYYIHRDRDVFPNPEKFDPDRFLPENCNNRHPFAYIPFSAGPRNCIGQRFAMMEEKVVLSTVLRNFHVESLDPRDKISPLAELVLRAGGPIRMRITPRQT